MNLFQNLKRIVSQAHDFVIDLFYTSLATKMYNLNYFLNIYFVDDFCYFINHKTASH